MSIGNISELADQYIANWYSNGDCDERLEHFREKFGEWLNQIPEDVQPHVLKLLDEFCYYSHNKANNLLASLHKILVSSYDVSENDTIYTFIKSKNGSSNSSNDYWTEYKNMNRLNKEICILDIKTIDDDEWLGIKNIVFIDDCSGTGKTFEKFISKNLNRFKGKTIYFISIHIMHDAEIYIEDFAKKNGLNIILINAKIQDKAFTRSCFGDGCDEAKQLITLTSRKKGIPNGEILGFEESESLMAFYNNTPNNTLGILRYDTESYFSIFPRERSKKPEWRKLKKKKQQQKLKNYNAALRSQDNDGIL